MIPIRLTLKNFMSYGDDPQTLSFEGMHVACLSGDNGNGKSAILDAITWALWGKTRASSVQSVSEDDLVRRSAEEMEVRFEFELNDQKYRVIRKRKRGRPGDWQFSQAVEGGQFVPIGAGSSREVGRQITQLLNMEYETFLASAYLQQGHADEFTRQKPAQRKQILGEILGLDQYDRLEARARERARELKSIMDDLDGQIRLLEAQAMRRETAETDLAAVRSELAAVKLSRSAQETVLTQWREKGIVLEQLADRRDAIARAAQGVERELRDAEAATEKQKLRLSDLEELIAQGEAIIRDYQALMLARRRREQLEPEIEEYSRKSTEIEGLGGLILVEQTRLEGEAKALELQAEAAARHAAELNRLTEQTATLRSELETELPLHQDLAAAESQLESLRTQFETLKARNRELSEQQKEIAEIIELLDRPQAACPVCETDLTGAKRERVLERQQARKMKLAEEQLCVQREGSACRRAVEEHQGKVKEMLARRDALTAARSRLVELDRIREALECALVELQPARAKAEALRRQIASGDFLHAKRLQRRLAEQEMKRLALVKEEYESLIAKARTYAEADLRHDRLREAEEHLEAERQEMERRIAVAESKRQALAAQSAELSVLDTRLHELDEIRRQTKEAGSEVARLDAELAVLQRREGSAETFLEDCRKSAEYAKEKEKERKRIHQEQWTYDRLAACFGKRGIQALIIENAIPELETEANDLLARMTDNGMQIRFLTTRAGKTSKSEIETLDISITDDVGPRPYELFSGGEAFRVNFAIRIALSRLLAHRSGARLQTLIMDEGFGTQDGKGREKLIEAIDAIKGDFETILVITHVEELKDAFSQRIEVTKDGRGSKIYVF